MTYCGGILVRDGLVMFADTRTNAGVDNISTFRKLHVFKDAKKRIMAIASAGNLSISQSVLSTLTEGYENPETGERETLMNSPTMFQAAQRVGHVIRSIHATEGKALEASDVTFELKVGLVSINSTMRSNLSVGMPIDLLVVRRDTCNSELIYRIEPGEPYFSDLRERWSAALRAAHIGIPRPPYRNRS